ncbi:hypothetical protein I4U23_012304 [Adineta vaga]|nr:hypothetical protein I4U23_012304 [Adineta vaga]
MSSLFTNLRLFSRYPTFIYASRLNAKMVSSKTNPPRDLARSIVKIVGLDGLITLLQMSRKEEQLIVHSVDKKPHPSLAPSK